MPLLTVCKEIQSVVEQLSSLLTAMDLATLIVCAIFVIFIFKLTWRPGGSNSVPGPKFSFPILGHLPLLGMEPWVTITQWTKIYGPIFAVKLGIYDVVMLNESNIIKEAFSRPEFSGRASFELFQSAMQGKGIAFSDGPFVAEQRNFVQKNLRGFGLRTSLFEENIHLELNQFLEDIDKRCGRPVVMKRNFSLPGFNAIWNIFMGRRFDHDDPQLCQMSQAVAKLGVDHGPLAALGLFIPAINKLMPELSGRNKKFQDFVDVYDFVKKAFDEPLPSTRTPGNPQNFKEAFIDEMERVGDNPASSFHSTHGLFQYTTGDILMGAIHATSGVLDWLLLCMAKHPEIQKKVQAEIDDIIGTSRRPALSDKDSTPYIEAVIQELLRFSCMTPLGAIFHRATEDTNIRGYNIKKDTLIVANTYGVHYDEDVWGDPENFRPERFIDASGTVDRHLTRIMLPFSTGKRSCVGENLARDQIYLFCTSCFQRFDVSGDENLTFDTTVGFVRAPKDFKLTFTRRSAE